MAIAITGGIAEGKSTVLAILSKLGATTGSADIVAKDVYDDPLVQQKLTQLLERENFTRQQLRETLRENDTVRRAVNRLLHPMIIQRLLAQQDQFVEIPLLFEVCLQGSFSEVWVVSCGIEEQTRRLTARYGPDKPSELMNTQLSSRVRLAFADVFIDSGANLMQVEAQLVKELKRVQINPVV